MQKWTSFQRNEPRRMGGTNTRSTMLNGLVRNGKLGKVMADHFRLDFNLVECLAIVHTDNASNHFGYNNHIPQVGSDWFWFLSRWGLPFLIQYTRANIMQE
ncbi:hypothetical protein GOBAR_DD01825 [Gossypium barbadense]|nr:hypothetical protein GOBAR_DD01825 [Gossypium barbadense]